jgi:hypothetical protein
MPQVVKGGSLPVLASATVVPVYFSGDALQPAIDANLKAWPTSRSFQALAEYGITSATIGTSIIVSETPAATLTQSDIQAWIEGKLDGSHPEFGLVDSATLASKVFVFFYPATSNVSWLTISECQSSYNAGVTLASGAVANYAVVAECGTPSPGLSETDALTGSALGAVASQMASPESKVKAYPTNWEFFDTAHAQDALVSLASVQVLGGCALAEWSPVPSGGPMVAGGVVLDSGVPQDALLYGFAWSNKAAAAYHDPCVPNVGGSYFVSVPAAHDEVQVTLQPLAGPMVVTATGVLVPVGSTKTVDVELLSDGPTSGPWTVSTQLLFGTGFTFSFDRTTGQNGDVLHLSITAPSKPQQGTVALYSTLEGRRTFYVFPVQSM